MKTEQDHETEDQDPLAPLSHESDSSDCNGDAVDDLVEEEVEHRDNSDCRNDTVDEVGAEEIVLKMEAEEKAVPEPPVEAPGPPHLMH